MTYFQKILVPLDGSELSAGVFPWLRAMAGRSGERLQVTLVRAFEPPGMVYLLPELALPTANPFNDEYLGTMVLEYLRERSRELPECRVDVEILVGEPAQEILTKSNEFDLILMASHGRGGLGRWLLGSVATKVARGATVPLMVVSARSMEETAGEEKPLTPIMVAVDGSDPSERAFRAASDFAAQVGSRVVLYQGVSREERQHFMDGSDRAAVAFAQTYLRKLAESESRVEVECRVVETERGSGIADFARDTQPAFVVMGTQGRGGVQRWMLGSETEKALQHLDCPVLIVP